MFDQKQRLRLSGLVLLIAGLALGMVFYWLAVWADLEAFAFDTKLGGEKYLTSLKCPVMITTHEKGQVSAVIKNELDRKIDLFVRYHATDGLFTLMREQDDRMIIEPHGTHRLTWEIDPEQAVWNRVVLVRVYQNGSYPMKSRKGSCGVLVFNAGRLTGVELTGLVVVLSLAGIYYGVYLWRKGAPPLEGPMRTRYSALKALVLVVTGGILTALMGWWGLGLLLIIVNIFLVLTLGAMIFGG